MEEVKKDKTLNCSECNKPFAFTAGEQRFYESKEFQPPKRCPACRATRKKKKEEYEKKYKGNIQS